MKFVIVVVVVACIMLIASRMRRNSLQRSDSMLADSSAPVMEDVHAAIAKGEKIRAIKVYREVTDADLRTAKDAVDRIVRGEDPMPQTHVSHDYDLTEVHVAIAEGEKIRAVKIYRQATDADLRTAKNAVDRIVRGEDPTPQTHVSHDYDLTEVHAAIAKGEKIRAIKVYREVTGADLRTAKDAVDRIVRGQAPDGVKGR